MSILKTRLTTENPISWTKERLTDGGFPTADAWSTVFDFSITGGKAVYTHSSGVGQLIQLVDDLALPLVAGTTYQLTYTVSSKSGDVQLSIVGATLEEIPSTDGTHIVNYTEAAVMEGKFIITAVSTSGALSLDDLSLTEIKNFNGFLLATLVGTETTFWLNGDTQVRVPAAVKVPIEDGVFSTEVQPFQNAQVSPVNNTYTFKWYDIHNNLRVTETSITLDEDEEEITPPVIDED